MKRFFVEQLCALLLILMGVGLAIQFLVPAHAREQTTFSKQLLSAVTTGSAAVDASYPSQCRSFAIYAEWSAGVSAGVITVETAVSSAYAGTWASLGTISWTAASKVDVLQVGQTALAVRTRVSTTVVGGTVNTWIVCN